MKKAAFYTLGCRSNQYETEALKNNFYPDYEILDGFKEAADVFVINTCIVTHDAERKSRQAIRRALREGKRVIVTGCYSNLKKDEIKELFQEVETLNPYPLLPFKKEKGKKGMRVRANLMIENGCENFCAYCIVPYARGKVKRKPISEVIAEAEAMAEAGIKEIVLTGINLGEYGINLIKVIKKLSNIKKILRVRLSSIEPMYVNQELIETIAETPKACHHLHIPLQTGDDKLLALMGRNYTSRDYLKMVKNIREIIPDCAITTDVIAGLPGETEEAFQNTVSLINKIQFSGMHLFPYSKRPGTRAAGMPDQVDVKTIKNRMKTLQKLRDKHKNEFINKFIGKKVEILVEKRGEGLTSNYIKVKFNDPLIKTGSLYTLILQEELAFE